MSKNNITLLKEILEQLPDIVVRELVLTYGSKSLKKSSFKKTKETIQSLSSSLNHRDINPIEELVDCAFVKRLNSQQDLISLQKVLISLMKEKKYSNQMKRTIQKALDGIREKLLHQVTEKNINPTFVMNNSLMKEVHTKKNIAEVAHIPNNMERKEKKRKKRLFIQLFLLTATPLLKELAAKYFSKKSLKKHPIRKNNGDGSRLYHQMMNRAEDPTSILIKELANRYNSTDKETLKSVLNLTEFSCYHSIVKEHLYEKSLNKRVKEHTKRMKRTSSWGFVYFIRENKNSDSKQSHIKIGVTTNFERRLSEFVISVPYPLELFHVIYSENGKESEHLLHSYFEDKHINGEWFELTSSDLLSIKLLQFPDHILKSITGTYFIKQ